VDEERRPFAQSDAIAEEAEPPRGMKRDKPREEEPAEQLGKDVDRRRKAGRDETQRSPSSEIPPPGTIMWICGWCVSAEPRCGARR